MTKLIYDQFSDNFSHYDLNEQTGELTPHRFTHRKGSVIKEVMKLNKETRKLVKMDQYDINKYINSFKEETDVKQLVERLRAKGVTPEEYIKNTGGFFGDVSEAPQSVLEAIQMAKDWQSKIDIMDAWKDEQLAKPVVSDKKEKPEKKEEVKKEEVKKDEK